MATAYLEYQPAQNHHDVLPPGAFLSQPGIDQPLRETLQELTVTARDLLAKNALCREIEMLCHATLTIDSAFCDIGQKLAEATKEQRQRVQLYDTCCDLETQWKQHHETYRQLLRRSRKVAGKAQYAVDDFRKVFLPSLRDPSTTLSERRQLVLDQIEELEDKSNTSNDITQEFLDFGRTLDTYIADFSRIVEGLGRSEQTERVFTLEKRLRSAKAAMDVVSEEVKELGWKFAGDVVVTGIAALLAIVAPTWWANVAGTVATGIDARNTMNSGFQYLEGLRKRESAVREYKAIKNEYDLEHACLRQMVNLQSTLDDARPIVHDVTTKLGAFASVWAAITADIGALQESLSYVRNPNSKLFSARVQTLENLYGCFSEALRYYQVTVRLPLSKTGLDKEKADT